MYNLDSMIPLYVAHRVYTHILINHVNIKSLALKHGHQILPPGMLIFALTSNLEDALG
jgi:hypothetical protein